MLSQHITADVQLLGVGSAADVSEEDASIFRIEVCGVVKFLGLVSPKRQQYSLYSHLVNNRELNYRQEIKLILSSKTCLYLVQVIRRNVTDMA
jgi:hypothetical protein